MAGSWWEDGGVSKATTTVFERLLPHGMPALHSGWHGRNFVIEAARPASRARSGYIAPNGLKRRGRTISGWLPRDLSRVWRYSRTCSSTAEERPDGCFELREPQQPTSD